MKEKLENTTLNSGVGISVGRVKNVFDPSSENVKLKFDDGTEGRAVIKKDSWERCTHIISDSIGEWARNNGLWKKKLTEQSVKLYIKVLEANKEYYIAKK